jgi:hypothetical protein
MVRLSGAALRQMARYFTRIVVTVQGPKRVCIFKADLIRILARCGFTSKACGIQHAPTFALFNGVVVQFMSLKIGDRC